MQPGVSIASQARQHDLNANVLFNWRHQFKTGKLLRPSSSPVLPVQSPAASNGRQWKPGANGILHGILGKTKCEKALKNQGFFAVLWRRGWDSNPR